MKKLNEMTSKELKAMAKDAKVKNWWNLKKEELIAELEKIEAAKKEKKAAKKEKKESKRVKKAIKVQREFVKVGEDRRDKFGYISISVKCDDWKKGSEYAEALVKKMNEMYEFGTNGEDANFTVLGCPDTEGGYTDTISFIKDKGHVADQRLYVGKLMTEAMKKMATEK
jgi:hypothetical protein